MPRIIHIISFLIILTFTSLQSFSQGCSQCKAQIESSEENGLSVGNGLNSGILLLMIAPYLIMIVVFRKQIFKFLVEFSGMWKSK
jgi:hypothetical protein